MSMTIWIWLLVALGQIAIIVAVLLVRYVRSSRSGSYPAGPPPPGQPDPVTLAATAPSRVIDHPMKPYGTLGDCRVWMDGHALRWQLRLSRSTIKVTMGSGQIPLAHITGVRIVEIEKDSVTLLNNFPALPGPAVAVATPQGEACFAVEDPQLFAAQLDARLRALGLPSGPR